MHTAMNRRTSTDLPAERIISSRLEWTPSTFPVRIGLALGGGFARGIAHAGVLKVFEQHGIPIHCITGISAGSIVAAAYASGTPVDVIGRIGCSMRFCDVARFRPGRLGIVTSDAMTTFLKGLLSTWRFEEMRIPLGVIATDLATGEPVVYSGSGPALDPIRASCAYPGLFQPVRHQRRLLVDGAMSMGVPAGLARQLGATHVISVPLPAGNPAAAPSNVFQVVNRCFQILQGRFEDSWRNETDLVIAPQVRGVEWHDFSRGGQLVEAGKRAALAVVPQVRDWLRAEQAEEAWPRPEPLCA